MAEDQSRGAITSPCGKWKLVEEQQEPTKEIVFTADRPSRIVVMIHPRYSNPLNLAEPEEDKELEERAEQLATAHNSIDVDFDWEQRACFYCGEELETAPCTACGLQVCETCTSDVGCHCMLAENEQVIIDSFVPKPGQAKATTFKKSQKRIVKKGSDAVKKQREAVRAALTGKSG